MVSLMPEIPLPSTSAAVITPSYEKKRKYSPEELATFQFDPVLLTVSQIRQELAYYKDNKDIVGLVQSATRMRVYVFYCLPEPLQQSPSSREPKQHPQMSWGLIRLGRFFQKEQLLYDVPGRCHVYQI